MEAVTRRGILIGMGISLAIPAIVKVTSLMPVSNKHLITRRIICHYRHYIYAAPNEPNVLVAIALDDDGCAVSRRIIVATEMAKKFRGGTVTADELVACGVLI